MKKLKYAGIILLTAFILLSSCSKENPQPREEQEITCESPLDAVARFLSLDNSDQAIKIDGFLKVPDITGESKHEGHEGEIEIISIDWNTGIHIAGATGGERMVGKKIQSFTFTKTKDKATPELKEAFASQKMFPEVVFVIRKTSGGQQQEMKIQFKDCLISSYSTGSSQEGLVNETLSFNWSRARL